jgi:type IV secretory pathway VirB10-like protein
MQKMTRAIVTLFVLSLAAIALWQRRRISALIRTMTGEQEPQTAQPDRQLVDAVANPPIQRSKQADPSLTSFYTGDAATSPSITPPHPASAPESPAKPTADIVPTDEDVAGELNLAGDDLTITDRVRTNLGRESLLDGLPHLNVNTQEGGVVYLRGIVQTAEQREAAETVALLIEGVNQVVNEIELERDINA